MNETPENSFLNICHLFILSFQLGDDVFAD